MSSEAKPEKLETDEPTEGEQLSTEFMADYCKREAVVDFDAAVKKESEELRRSLVAVDETSAMFFENWVQKQLYIAPITFRSNVLSQTIFTSALAQCNLLANTIVNYRRSAKEAKETMKVPVEGTDKFIPVDVTYIKRLRTSAIRAHRAMVNLRLMIVLTYFTEITNDVSANALDGFVDELTYPYEIVVGTRVAISKTNLKKSFLQFINKVALQQVSTLDFIDAQTFPNVDVLVDRFPTNELPYELTDEGVTDVFTEPEK